MPLPKRIRDIEYGRIDRVADGAQPGAHIPLVKARTVRVPTTKEQSTMPVDTDDKKLDLSKLDEATRTAIEAQLTEAATAKTAGEAAAAERDALAADKVKFDEAVAALEAEANKNDDANDDDEVEDLSTVEGIEKAIKKTRSAEMKRLLKATKVQLEKAAADHEEVVELRKADRRRTFLAKSNDVKHIAAHAKVEKTAKADEVSGVDALADLLDTIDAKCGTDTANAVHALLSKAQTQLVEVVKPLLKAAGKTGGEVDGMAEILDTGDDDASRAEAEIATRAADLRKAKPDLTNAQARREIAKSNPDLVARARKTA